MDVINTVPILNQDFPIEKRLYELSSLGMNTIRINVDFSQIEKYLGVGDLVKDVASKTELKIMLDVPIPGAKIRIGNVDNGLVKIKKGIIVIFNSDSYQINQTEKTNYIPVSLNNVGRVVKPDQILFYGDGNGRFVVTNIYDNNTFEAMALDNFDLRSNRGLYIGEIRNTLHDHSTLNTLITLLETYSPDYLALSFVENPEQILKIRDIIDKTQENKIQIVSKIESIEGLNNLHNIIAETDLVMVARGDLGITSDFRKLGIFQKQIISSAKSQAKRVIVATHILDSLCYRETPSRAEVLDLTQMILDEVDYVILSQGIIQSDSFVDQLNKIKDIIGEVEDWRKLQQEYNRTVVFN